MSAPVSHDPLVVNTQDGSCWRRRAVTREGRGLYALADVQGDVPELALAPLSELAERGIVGSADVLPVSVGTEPQPSEVEQLRAHSEFLMRDVKRLRARVAELEAERHTTNEALDDAVQELRERDGRITKLAERLRAGQHWQRGRNPELVSENHVSQSELREIFGIPLAAPWESEPAIKCRCDEPDADPYACEADDCSGYFSELNPFGGARPVDEPSAEVSRTCKCGWRTTVWHVDDGSAEEELHGHVVRVHGGTYPAETGGAQ